MTVLIITNDFDYVTDQVIDWLFHYNCKVYRLTFEDFLRKASIYYELNSKSILKIEIDGIKIHSGWLRKVTFDDRRLSDLVKKFGFKDGYEIFKYFIKESSVLKQLILNRKNIKWLCDYNSVNLNKLEVLALAKECELETPRTIIVNNSKLLERFLNKNSINRFIIKSVGENLSLLHNTGYSIFQPVKSFNKDSIKDFPEKFAPSLFQEEIIKKNLIRRDYAS
ncbi:MAG: hypothetical protein AB7E36_14740 [Salinivirgaceae bacterium]